jgi:hypothetical protein
MKNKKFPTNLLKNADELEKKLKSKEDERLNNIRNFQGSVKDFLDYWKDKIEQQKKV